LSTALVNGVGLRYEIHGEGFPIVLLNGLGGNRKDWYEQVPVFSQHYQTITYDHRGTGDSNKPETGYSIDQFADDCIGVLDHLDLERVHLVGYSMGGRIAQVIASRHPNRVAALVLAATAAKPNALNLYSLKLGAYLYKNYGPSAAASVGPLVDFTHSYFAKALPVLVDKLGAVPENPMPLHAFMGHVGAIEGHDTSGVLGSIRSPTLVVIGDQEWLNPLPDANALVEGIPDARLQVITGASHGLIVEQPEQFNQCVLDFFCEYHRLADGLSLS